MVTVKATGEDDEAGGLYRLSKKEVTRWGKGGHRGGRFFLWNDGTLPRKSRQA